MSSRVIRERQRSRQRKTFQLRYEKQLCETGRRGQIGEYTAIIRMRENTKDIDRERLRNRDIGRDRQKNRQRRQNQKLPKLNSKRKGNGTPIKNPLKTKE